MKPIHNDPDVTGYQWVLSSRHHITDECTMMSELDSGAGPGVYLKKDCPPQPVHPNCMCMLVPYVDEPPGRTTFETFKDYLEGQSDRDRADMIGKANAQSPVLYRRGLERRGINPDRPGEPRRIPEELIVPRTVLIEDHDGTPIAIQRDVVFRTPEEIQAESVKVGGMLDKYSDRESKWSGTTQVSNKRCDEIDARAFKDWNCDIVVRDDIDGRDLVHEHLHARSVSHFAPLLYPMYWRTEEAATELYAQEISIKEGIVAMDFTYSRQVDALREFRKRTGLYDNDFDFAKKLFEIDMPKRYIYLDGTLTRLLGEGKISDADATYLRRMLKSLLRLETVV